MRNLLRAFRDALGIPDSPYPKEPDLAFPECPKQTAQEAIKEQPERDPRDVQIEWLTKELRAAKAYGDNVWTSCREYYRMNEACWKENQEIKTRLRQAIGQLRNELDPEL